MMYSESQDLEVACGVDGYSTGRQGIWLWAFVKLTWHQLRHHRNAAP